MGKCTCHVPCKHGRIKAYLISPQFGMNLVTLLLGVLYLVKVNGDGQWKRCDVKYLTNGTTKIWDKTLQAGPLHFKSTVTAARASMAWTIMMGVFSIFALIMAILPLLIVLPKTLLGFIHLSFFTFLTVAVSVLSIMMSKADLRRYGDTFCIHWNYRAPFSLGMATLSLFSGLQCLFPGDNAPRSSTVGSEPSTTTKGPNPSQSTARLSKDHPSAALPKDPSYSLRLLKDHPSAARVSKDHPSAARVSKDRPSAARVS